MESVFELFKRALKQIGIKPYTVRVYLESIIRRFLALLHYRRFGMFSVVMIELSSFCNRRCLSCPVSIAPRVEKQYMSDDIFYKILNELSSIKYKGSIVLSLYNEPLEDEKIVKRVSLAHKMVPLATIKINSNGDYLSSVLLTRLYESGLGNLYVTAYSDDVFNKLKKISCVATKEENNIIEIRKAPHFIGNRAGTIGGELKTLHSDCYLPKSQLIINYKLNVVICCNDYFEKILLGNVEDHLLLSIWYGDKFNKVRRILKNKQREKLSTCYQCNYYCSPYKSTYLAENEIVNYNMKNKF